MWIRGGSIGGNIDVFVNIDICPGAIYVSIYVIGLNAVLSICILIKLNLTKFFEFEVRLNLTKKR